MDATLLAVLITLGMDIVAKWRQTRAEGRTRDEMSKVIHELKALHEVNTLAIAAVNRRVDQVEARLNMVEGPTWRGLSSH